MAGDCYNRHAIQAAGQGRSFAIHVTSLSLTHFRNYASLAFEPADGVTLLTGGNGQGKTNVLESLHVLATGHSHRADTDREVIGWSASREPIRTRGSRRMLWRATAKLAGLKWSCR